MTSQLKPALAIVALLGLYLIVTSSFFPLSFLTVFDAKRVLQLLLFAGITISAVTWSPLRMATIEQLTLFSVFSRYILALFFLIGIASSLRLDHPSYALIDVSMMFVMMILIAVTAASRKLVGDRFDKWAVVLLAALGFAVFIQEFMGFVAGWVLEVEFSYNQALIHFAHPRFYNQLQTWSIPILAALPILFQNKRWVMVGCVVLIGLQWFLVIALAARGTTVSLFVAMVFISFWLPDSRKFWLKYQLLGLFVGMMIYFFILFLNGLLIPHSRSGEFYEHSIGRPIAHTSGRSTLWQLSIEDAIKNPVLGSGPTRYACDSNLVLPAHAHSFIFRILGEWGFIAAFLVFVLITTIGIGFLKNLKYSKITNESDPTLRAILAISLIAGVIHACLSGVFIMPASQVSLILIGGWGLSLATDTERHWDISNVTNLLLILGTILASTQFLFSLSEISHIEDRTQYSEDYGQLAPRFWQDGRVCEYSYQTHQVLK